MKISKLFHWLYAIVMLLPIFAIGVTCGYAMFNKNAYQSFEGTYAYDGTVNYGEKTNISSSDFEVFNSNYKYVNVNQNNYLQYKVQETLSYQNFINVFHISEVNTNIEWNNDFIIDNDTYLSIGARENSTNRYVITFVIYKITDINQIQYQNGWNNARLFDDNLYVYELAKAQVNSQLYNNEKYMNFISDSVTSYSYNTSLYLFEHINIDTYVIENTLSNVFYYSVDKVTQSPYFNWAYDSFLVAPFSYIVNLFSMPTNSPVVMLLSYWLSISIIWLVFDLIMYVPLLVHRWLDKGVLE